MTFPPQTAFSDFYFQKNNHDPVRQLDDAGLSALLRCLCAGHRLDYFSSHPTSGHTWYFHPGGGKSSEVKCFKGDGGLLLQLSIHSQTFHLEHWLLSGSCKRPTLTSPLHAIPCKSTSAYRKCWSVTFCKDIYNCLYSTCWLDCMNTHVCEYLNHWKYVCLLICHFSVKDISWFTVLYIHTSIFHLFWWHSFILNQMSEYG